MWEKLLAAQLLSFGSFSWGSSMAWQQCAFTYLKKPQLDSRQNRAHVLTPSVVFWAGRQKCSWSKVGGTWVVLPVLNPGVLLDIAHTSQFVAGLSKWNLELVLWGAFSLAASRLLQELLLTFYIYADKGYPENGSMIPTHLTYLYSQCSDREQ